MAPFLLKLRLFFGSSSDHREAGSRSRQVSSRSRISRPPPQVNTCLQQSLHIAIIADSLTAVRAALDAGADAGAPDNSDGGDTALHLAVRQPHQDSGQRVLRWLLTHPTVRPYRRNAAGWEPVHTAAAAGNSAALIAMAEVLGPGVLANPTVQADTALHVAVFTSQAGVLAALLRHRRGLELLESRDRRGRTPLLLAVRLGQWAAARLLLCRGARVSAPDNLGRRAIHAAAATRGRLSGLVPQDEVRSVMRAALAALDGAAGADPPASLVAATWLILHGADPTQPDSAGVTGLRILMDAGIVGCEAAAGTTATAAAAAAAARRRLRGCPPTQEVLTSACAAATGTAPASADRTLCRICMSGRSLKVAFGCGHLACVECSTQLSQCHLCRRQIDHKLHLYW